MPSRARQLRAWELGFGFPRFTITCIVCGDLRRVDDALLAFALAGSHASLAPWCGGTPDDVLVTDREMVMT